MRLYYYGIDNNLGGLENYAKTLLTGIREQDPSIDITIITEHENMAYKDYFISLGIDIITIPYKTHIIGYYQGLKKVLNNHYDCDILQLNVMSYRNNVLLRAAKKSGIKTIIVGHSNGLTGSFISKLLHKVNVYRYRRFGKHIAISQEVASYMFSFDKGGPTILPNGIDIGKYKYNELKRKELRKKFNFKNNDIIIGQVGRISFQKNQVFSTKLIKKINVVSNNYKMVFIGANQNKKYLSLIKKTHNCIYLGETKSIEDYYSMFDIFIMPSMFEGYGLTIYEALANGLKVIIGNNVPYPTFIEGSITQLPLITEIWANNIFKLEKQEEREKRAPSRGIYNYSIEVFLDKYLNMIRHF